MNILQNAVQDAPFSAEVKDLTLDFFQQFSKLNQQQYPQQETGTNGGTC